MEEEELFEILKNQFGDFFKAAGNQKPDNNGEFKFFLEGDKPGDPVLIFDDEDDLIDHFFESMGDGPNTTKESKDDDKDICPFYLNGLCKYGKTCRNFHPSEDDDLVDKVNFDGDQDCGICIEKIIARDKKFGILCNLSFND
jgi:hypothetical protein